MASHNIFDLGFALSKVKEFNLESHVEFEILEGMAPELESNLRSLGAKLVIYTPLVSRHNYNAAIAYLVRRLDEGTQKGNFLKEGFQLTYKSLQWSLIWDQFQSSYDLIKRLPRPKNRLQDRNDPYPELP